MPADSVEGDQETGLLIVSVEDGSPAEGSGLLLGDTIVRVAGASIADHGDLLEVLGEESVSSAVQVTVIRGGVKTVVEVEPAERS